MIPIVNEYPDSPVETMCFLLSLNFSGLPLLNIRGFRGGRREDLGDRAMLIS